MRSRSKAPSTTARIWSKALFADAQLRRALNLAAVNSINWARIAAQTVYYFAAAAALGAPDRPVSFSVPTGNFGNVYAGHIARRMGLPIERLVIGTNRNDILARYIASGEMAIAPVEPSLSPSMDIQVSSNFERLLFELKERDGAAVGAAIAEFSPYRRPAAVGCGMARGARLVFRPQGRRHSNHANHRSNLCAVGAC